MASRRLIRETKASLGRLPAEMRSTPHWVRFKLFEQDEKGKRKKMPWHATKDAPGSSTDSTTWGTFEAALAAVGTHETCGIGYVFAADDPFVGIDLDHCFDEAGRMTDQATQLVVEFATYAEMSLSRTGVHLLGRGVLPGGGKGRKNQAKGLEVYCQERFFTCTGWQLEGTSGDARDVQAVLDRVMADEFGEGATPPAPAPPPAAGSSESPGSADRRSRYVQKAIEGECARVRGSAAGERHDNLLKAAFSLGQLVASGALDQATVEAELQRAAAEVFPSDRKREINRTIKDGIKGAAATPRNVPEPAPSTRTRGAGSSKQPKEQPPADTPAEPEAPPPGSDEHFDKPVVLVPGLHVTDQGEYFEIGGDAFNEAVLAALPPGTIYRRAESIGELAGRPGHRYFKVVSAHRLRSLIDRHVRLMQWHGKQDRETKQWRRWRLFKTCTTDLAQLVLADAMFSDAVRDLETLTGYPIYMGPNFELAVPGWNEGYGVFYDPPPGFGELDLKVPIDECQRRLRELVVDFPFREEADRVNFWAGLLTPIVRPALDANTPMFFVQSSLPRTGKSKLIEQVAGGIILGRHVAARQLGDNEGEREKRLTAIVRKGDTLIHLDNMADFIDSPALASVLTAKIYAARTLSTLEDLEAPNNMTVFASGNNPRATGEILKRCVPIVLQPANDSPEKRTAFAHRDLPNYVRTVRMDVLSALFSMVEHWKTFGKEPWSELLGGFERWAEVVGGVLFEAGIPGFMANASEWRDKGDPDREDMRAFVAEWWVKSGGSEKYPKDLFALAEELGVFGWIHQAKNERSAHTRLGNLLRKHVDTPIGEFCIQQGRGRAGTTYYLAFKGQGSAGSAEVQQNNPS